MRKFPDPAFILRSALASNNHCMWQPGNFPRNFPGNFHRHIYWYSFLTLLLAGMLTGPAARAEMRCGESLVERGFTPLEVLARCGEPQFEMQWSDYRYPGIWLRVDEWSYNLGSNRFRRLLTFENGRLIRIETRDKPKLPRI